LSLARYVPDAEDNKSMRRSAGAVLRTQFVIVMLAAGQTGRARPPQDRRGMAASTNWQRGYMTGWPRNARTGGKSSKESDMSVYRVTEIIGTSSTSWEDAAAEAIRTAAVTLRDLRVAEVVKQDIHLDERGAITYRTKLQLSFKYEPEH
jgi:flavin-binding protein dodecin